MSSGRILLMAALALIVVSTCEPQNVAIAQTAAPSASTSAAATSAGTSVAASGAPGSTTTAPSSPGVATITSTGTSIRVSGTASVLKTPMFDLSGPVTMKLSTCRSTGASPFVWLYNELNATVGQYVEEVTAINTAKGKYYLKVVSPQDCSWTIDFSPQ
jgi:hypothetical protein